MNLYKTIAVGLVCTAATTISVAAIVSKYTYAGGVMLGVGVCSVLALVLILVD